MVQDSTETARPTALETLRQLESALGLKEKALVGYAIRKVVLGRRTVSVRLEHGSDDRRIAAERDQKIIRSLPKGKYDIDSNRVTGTYNQPDGFGIKLSRVNTVKMRPCILLQAPLTHNEVLWALEPHLSQPLYKIRI